MRFGSNVAGYKVIVSQSAGEGEADQTGVHFRGSDPSIISNKSKVQKETQSSRLVSLSSSDNSKKISFHTGTTSWFRGLKSLPHKYIKL
jgi:hypothetical protein